MKKEESGDSESIHSATDTAIGDLKCVPELWFEDDNLTLRAEDSIFRISKGFLAARPPVLKTMFSALSHPSAGMLYGCPILELPHASVDVTNFLKAIFNLEYVATATRELQSRHYPTVFFMPPPARAPFSVVIAVLALAHEYGVASLLKRALLHLETFFPITLDGARNYDAPAEGSGMSMLSCDLIALQAASDVGASWCLPSIIYECCTFSLAELLDNTHWHALPACHKRTLLLAHAAQKRGVSTVTRFLFVASPTGCRSAAKCNTARLLWLDVVDAWRATGRDSVPLEFWDDSDWGNMDDQFCDPCLTRFQTSYAQAREVLWTGLPRMYGLHGWDALNKMRAEVFVA
ncbi:hypothetical protein B0H17DRAFT_1218501 [Mycena rosella]|uniref:BTB domain-containing protein n=1 Tax=Mycena rosella TaxID=1033263 RepID=A0AAD7BP72_MYCRO|nr:hypothetical protein B0H17DRAFT_1218501 [Mycena rosella]